MTFELKIVFGHGRRWFVVNVIHTNYCCLMVFQKREQKNNRYICILLFLSRDYAHAPAAIENII